jgi:hypothetical protein
MATRKLTPVQVLQRLQHRVEKRIEGLQRVKLEGYEPSSASWKRKGLLEEGATLPGGLIPFGPWARQDFLQSRAAVHALGYGRPSRSLRIRTF